MKLSPDVQAHVDQNHATVRDILDRMIRAMVEYRRLGLSREEVYLQTLMFIVNQETPYITAGVLAEAISRLTEQHTGESA